MPTACEAKADTELVRLISEMRVIFPLTLATVLVCKWM